MKKPNTYLCALATSLLVFAAFQGARADDDDCCGETKYDPNTEECCGGTTVVPNGSCCGGQTLGENEGCCNGVIFNTTTHFCCEGEVQPLGFKCCSDEEKSQIRSERDQCIAWSEQWFNEETQRLTGPLNEDTDNLAQVRDDALAALDAECQAHYDNCQELPAPGDVACYLFWQTSCGIVEGQIHGTYLAMYAVIYTSYLNNLYSAGVEMERLIGEFIDEAQAKCDNW